MAHPAQRTGLKHRLPKLNGRKVVDMETALNLGVNPVSRDSQSVALEFIDLVQRTVANQERCRQLLAVKLELIYDFAYAMGYKAGTGVAREHAYDLGFADGSRFAHAKLPAQLPAGNHNGDGNHEALNYRPNQRKHLLYGLPCDVCGALYVDNQCPVCSSRANPNAMPAN